MIRSIEEQLWFGRYGWNVIWVEWINVNSSVYWGCDSKFKSVISEPILGLNFVDTSCEIVLRWVPQNSHCQESRYLSQFGSWPMSPNGISKAQCVNTLRPRQNDRHFADDTFKRIFLNENVRIAFKISLKIVPKGPIKNIPTLVQMMALRRPDDKPLSEPMTVSLLTHICVTRPQWVNEMHMLLWN